MTIHGTSGGWPYDRGIQSLKEIHFLNMRTQSAAAALDKLWGDTFLTNAGINAGPSSGYTYRGASNYDVIAQPATTRKLLCHFNNSGADSSQSAHSLSAIGTPTYSSSIKKFGSHAVEFNGTNQGFSIPDSADWEPGSGNFTIETWVRLKSLGALQAIFSWYDTGVGLNGFKFHITAANKLRFVAEVSGSPVIDVTSTGALTTGQWYHVAIVRNGSTYTLYIDGTADGSGTYAGSHGTGAFDAYIGTWGGSSEWLNGYLDDLRYDKGTAIYTGNFAVPTAELDAEADIRSVRALDLNTAVTAVIVFMSVTLNSGAFTAYVSMNDGSTWTALSAAQLETLIAVPSGTQIRVRCVLTGDAELESWGVAA